MVQPVCSAMSCVASVFVEVISGITGEVYLRVLLVACASVCFVELCLWAVCGAGVACSGGCGEGREGGFVGESEMPIPLLPMSACFLWPLVSKCSLGQACMRGGGVWDPTVCVTQMA